MGNGAHLVAALVGNDPQAGAHGTLQEPVRRPQQAPPHRRWHRGVAEEGGGKVQRRHSRQISAQVGKGCLQRPLKAVCRDCFTQTTCSGAPHRQLPPPLCAAKLIHGALQRGIVAEKPWRLCTLHSELLQSVHLSDLVASCLRSIPYQRSQASCRYGAGRLPTHQW